MRKQFDRNDQSDSYL